MKSSAFVLPFASVISLLFLVPESYAGCKPVLQGFNSHVECDNSPLPPYINIPFPSVPGPIPPMRLPRSTDSCLSVYTDEKYKFNIHNRSNDRIYYAILGRQYDLPAGFDRPHTAQKASGSDGCNIQSYPEPTISFFNGTTNQEQKVGRSPDYYFYYGRNGRLILDQVPPPKPSPRPEHPWSSSVPPKPRSTGSPPLDDLIPSPPPSSKAARKREERDRKRREAEERMQTIIDSFDRIIGDYDDNQAERIRRQEIERERKRLSREKAELERDRQQLKLDEARLRKEEEDRKQLPMNQALRPQPPTSISEPAVSEFQEPSLSSHQFSQSTTNSPVVVNQTHSQASRSLPANDVKSVTSSQAQLAKRIEELFRLKVETSCSESSVVIKTSNGGLVCASPSSEYATGKYFFNGTSLIRLRT